jgi:hypothetical protein
MYATNYFETHMLNLLRGVAFAAPVSTYMALFLTNPTETGAAGVEVSYPGYARKPVVWTTPAPESGGIGIKNNEIITFATAAVNVGTITYVGIYDNATAGNMLLYGQPTEPLAVASGDAPVFVANEMSYYFMGAMSVAYKTKMLNTLRAQSISQASPHIALYNGDPENGGSELSGQNYARVPVLFSAPEEQAGGQMQVQNSAIVHFNRPVTDWGNWTHTVIMDAVSAGSPMWTQVQTQGRIIKKGYMPIFQAGMMKVAIN